MRDNPPFNAFPPPPIFGMKEGPLRLIPPNRKLLRSAKPMSWRPTLGLLYVRRGIRRTASARMKAESTSSHFPHVDRLSELEVMYQRKSVNLTA